MNLKPAAIRIASSNLSESELFYAESLGFRLKSGNVQDGYLVFATDSIDLVLEPQDDELVPGFVGLSFTVTEIHQVVTELKQTGVVFHGAPEKQIWGGWLAHFLDPSGNVLTLVEY